MVESQLSTLLVASSILVSRSKDIPPSKTGQGLFFSFPTA